MDNFPDFKNEIKKNCREWARFSTKIRKIPTLSLVAREKEIAFKNEKATFLSQNFMLFYFLDKFSKFTQKRFSF